MSVVVPVRILPHGEGLALPADQSAGAAGVDLCAAIPAHSTLVIEPGARELVPTGLTFALPAGSEAQIRPRSGLALKQGVTVLNSPGTIDSDYRGEVGVLLINLGSTPFEISRGDRIAQMVIAPVTQARFEQVLELKSTDRGMGGFGSTGVAHRASDGGA